MGRHLNGSAAGASQLDRALPTRNRPAAGIESEFAADLWSPPEHTTELLDDIDGGTTDGAGAPAPTERLVAAWMGALAGSDRADRRDGSPGADPNAYLHAEQVGDTGRDSDLDDDLDDDLQADPGGVTDGPRVAPFGDWPAPSAADPTSPSGRLPSTHRRTAWRSTLVTVMISLAASAAAGMAVLLITQGADPGEPRGDVPEYARPAQLQVDGRVVVPGAPPGCETMLVKPWPDGTTTNVGGTCFTVG